MKCIKAVNFRDKLIFKTFLCEARYRDEVYFGFNFGAACVRYVRELFRSLFCYFHGFVIVAFPQEERPIRPCSNICPLDTQQDPFSCECGCPVQACSRPRYFNPETCTCDCPTSPKSCINLQNFNEKTCRCDCDARMWVKCAGFDSIKCVCGGIKIV